VAGEEEGEGGTTWGRSHYMKRWAGSGRRAVGVAGWVEFVRGDANGAGADLGAGVTVQTSVAARGEGEAEAVGRGGVAVPISRPSSPIRKGATRNRRWAKGFLMVAMGWCGEFSNACAAGGAVA
jgi:hypothetical protein